MIDIGFFKVYWEGDVLVKEDKGVCDVVIWGMSFLGKGNEGKGFGRSKFGIFRWI